MKNSLSKQHHSFPCFIYPDSEILILGSFPSRKSREKQFYYMHPQNRFYKVLSAIYQEDFYYVNIEEKKKFLKKYHIALYDVIEECEIINSSDSSIKNIKPINLEQILKNSSIKRIILDGQLAYKLFLKYFPEYQNIAYFAPSTSPANARMKLEDLVKSYKTLLLF